MPWTNTDILRKFREAWALAPRTAGKELEHLRQIFKFAVESGWLSVNPTFALQVNLSAELAVSEP
jgi:site-specific recombinase XerD